MKTTAFTDAGFVFLYLGKFQCLTEPYTTNGDQAEGDIPKQAFKNPGVL